MKIDDLFDKTPATSLNMARKSKPTDKQKPEARASATPEKLLNEVKPGTAPDSVDTYESMKKPSESTMQTGSSSFRDQTPVRKEMVERARQLMAAGAYDSPDVIEKIIDRLMDTIREA
jgi:hypothetical protein